MSSLMAADFGGGWDELAAVKKKYGDEPWLEKVEGEFSAAEGIETWEGERAAIVEIAPL